MWKQKPESVSRQFPVPMPEPVRPDPAPIAETSVRPRTAIATADQGTLTAGTAVRGEITGVDPLYIDGAVEGTIHIPGERVTIGQHGSVSASKSGGQSPCIVAREIVIRGTVNGNIVATDRVDIRREASLTGDVSTARISIEDGAYFRGGIDILREQPPAEVPAPVEAAETIEV
ncbi:MAG TPA: polymer-forming cytoskeletal protein [Terracidiphilus sp.]|jgi:cytoskeletal protein CcmA (bactofilin family)